MQSEYLSIGVDLGGTKTEISLIDNSGQVLHSLRRPTPVDDKGEAIEKEITNAVQELQNKAKTRIDCIGIGIAGQIDSTQGIVRFAPNLKWHNVPLQRNLEKALNIPIYLANDVRAATFGEWIYGAGKGCKDLVCIFLGTGIGGGIVSDGQLLQGASNTAGEIGHMTIDFNGPPCTCPNRGCLEAFAGGWAIAKRAQKAIFENPKQGKAILEMAGGSPENVAAKTVIQAANQSDPLARKIMEEVFQALIAGTVNLINAFNPSRIVFGGGLLDGIPEVIDILNIEARKRALEAATAPLQILSTKLQGKAGAIGAAAMAKRMLIKTTSS